MLKMKSADLSMDEDGLGEGEFIAYASTFTAKDSYGDVMQKGSFDKTIEQWKNGDAVMPLLFNHDHRNPMHFIGEVKDMTPDERGLKTLAKFDLDTPRGAQVHKLVKSRRITQLSFAYDEIASHPVKNDPVFGDYKALDEVAMHEVSITPYGANRDTEVLAVKSALATLKHVDPAALADPEYLVALKAAFLKAAEALDIPVLSDPENDVNRRSEPQAGNMGASPSDLIRKFKLAGLRGEFLPTS